MQRRFAPQMKPCNTSPRRSSQGGAALALSCSSPFWEGEQTGHKSFRLTVYNSLPRTGLPERFESYGEFRRHLDTLIRNGLIEDTTKIWWDLRPSSRYPTLETRQSLYLPRRLSTTRSIGGIC